MVFRKRRAAGKKKNTPESANEESVLSSQFSSPVVEQEFAQPNIYIDEPMVTLRLFDDVTERVSIGQSSVVGSRKSQQDSVKVSDFYAYNDMQRTIAVLCDGMGGLSGGEIASNLCTKNLFEAFFTHDIVISNVPSFFKTMVHKLDGEVRSLKNDKGQPLNAGTTLASVAILEDKLFWTAVGDSRIYVIRNNSITCATVDHNYKMILDERVKQGLISKQEADTHPKREALVSYIGVGGVEYIDQNLKPFQLYHGDAIVMCSDGLYRTLSEREILSIVLRCGNDVHSAATELTDFAIGKGNRNQDNTSVVVIRYNQQ